VPRATYNVTSDTVGGNMRALALAARASAGRRSVKVAPFDDEMVRKVGVWVEGDRKEVDEVLAAVKKGLERTKDGYTAVPYAARRR